MYSKFVYSRHQNRVKIIYTDDKYDNNLPIVRMSVENERSNTVQFNAPIRSYEFGTKIHNERFFWNEVLELLPLIFVNESCLYKINDGKFTVIIRKRKI